MAGRLAGRLGWGLLVALLLLAALRLVADRVEPDNRGLGPSPCPPGEPGGLGIARLAFLTLAGRPPGLRDWADLCFYQAQNARITATGRWPRTVLIGDSIFQYWSGFDPGFFSDDRVNRGIAGQTSGQVLLRMTPDALALRPRVVHVLVGLNDVTGVNGPSRPEDYRNNIRAMVTLAKASGAVVVIGLLPPASGKREDRRARTIATIRDLNGWLARFAREEDLVLADYWSPLAAPDGSLRADLAADPSHPNAAGYAAMKAVALAAFAEAERRIPASGRQDQGSVAASHFEAVAWSPPSTSVTAAKPAITSARKPAVTQAR